MPKSADYVISGVFYVSTNTSKYVSEVLVHVVHDANQYDPGVKVLKETVIELIEQGYTFATMRWDYLKKGWYIGAEVDFLTRGGITHLRTHLNRVTIDNLDSLPNLTNHIEGI